MALQVSNYTVVDNNRNLTNITGVDATTAAAMGAAGVGAPSVSFTASETISQGDVVGVAAGQVGKSKKSDILQGSTMSYTAGLAGSGGDNDTGCMHWDAPSHSFIYVGSSARGSSSSRAIVRVMEINSTGGFAYPTTNSYGDILGTTYTASYAAGSGVASDGSGNFCGAMYVQTSSSSSSRQTRIFTWNMSSGSITNFYTVNQGNISANSNIYVAAYDTNKFIIVYQSSVTYDLRYTTIQKSGSSFTNLQSNQRLNSSSPTAYLCTLKGFTNHNVPAGKVICVAASENNSIWGSSGSVKKISASTLTINSSGVASMGTVTAATDNLGGYPSSTTNYYGASFNSYPVSPSGYFMQGEWSSSTGHLFRKASNASDAITYIEKGNLNYNEPDYMDAAAGTRWQTRESGNDLILMKKNMSYISQPGSWPEKTLSSTDAFLSQYNMTQIWDGVGTTYRGWTRHAFYNGYIIWLPAALNQTSPPIRSTHVGNLDILYGIAQNSASSGQSVSVAPLGQASTVHSGLTVGGSYGVGDTSGALSFGGSPIIGTALSSTSIHIQNNAE